MVFNVLVEVIVGAMIGFESEAFPTAEVFGAGTFS
jgi:hypothetical protein